jgi:hypothetical protein
MISRSMVWKRFEKFGVGMTIRSRATALLSFKISTAEFELNLCDIIESYDSKRQNILLIKNSAYPVRYAPGMNSYRGKLFPLNALTYDSRMIVMKI